MTRTKPHRTPDTERGDMAISTVMVTVVLTAFFLTAIAFGRVSLAEITVSAAASEAARSASLSRTVAQAQVNAEQAASSTLTNRDLKCSTTSVHTDLSAFRVPVGQPGTITTTVTCVVPLRDLGLAGLSSSRTITATGHSTLDAYRERG
ncbi:TadE/TadG family type IV pilus assembly protein [Promicromonospora sp. NFX87]|uniref:TadE/TadG family type IV pilus assembly protein n=1 Tax=Promicromonospora sp. NFX87 TaxID=3402691 RepID=UPI003AFAE09D